MITRINGIDLTLLPERMLYLAEGKALFLADWHLGKAAHFRKSGIPIPQPNLKMEFDVVGERLAMLSVDRVFFLGDLFHSLKNSDWQEFADFISQFPSIDFTLIKGNHDLIGDATFTEIGVRLATDYCLGDRLFLTHEPAYEKTPKGKLNLAGHLHPGFKIQLKARQSVTLPCFHYRNNTLVLPAFGSLTGLYRMEKGEGEAVFCILGEEVIAV